MKMNKKLMFGGIAIGVCGMLGIVFSCINELTAGVMASVVVCFIGGCFLGLSIEVNERWKKKYHYYFCH